MRKFHHIHLATLLVVITWPARRPDTEIKFIGRFPFRKNNLKFRWEQKVEFPIGKKLFHLVVNPGTSRCPTVDLELVQTTRNVTRMEHDIPFGNSNRENGPTFLDFPLFLGIFQWDEPTKRVPFTAEPEIPEILTKWKAP